MNGRTYFDDLLAPTHVVRKKKKDREEKYYEDMYGKGIPAAELASVKKKEAKAKQFAPKAYRVKRVAAPIVSIVVSVLAIAVVALGLVASMGKFAGVFTYGADKVNIVLLDPLFSVLKNMGVTLDAFPATFAEYMTLGDGTLDKIVSYAILAAVAIYVVFMVVIFFSAIAAAAKKKEWDGTYRKVKMGFLSIVAFVCMLIVAVAGMYAVGVQASEAIGFITGKALLSAGVGFYILLAVPIVTFICGCATFGKKK